eukprot:CAMPEP_0176339328 /NCGR_PEP_ID=MMETSP0126-20121128/681_1 /TAXON_ID=141414 ORGANISM="Strombidinopsis acuminatum, Strain SPMC142" /NCGR_SAMPLE_ID=MMETSP0126 /ASSEMBLY_ACC=CAM_ASM_000229 /LENGTH=100 /DNA_ID=CAMNT_0017682861 /DNA_START=451 /DNA_END=753 /DNA_ORIENTATION=+
MADGTTLVNGVKFDKDELRFTVFSTSIKENIHDINVTSTFATEEAPFEPLIEAITFQLNITEPEVIYIVPINTAPTIVPAPSEKQIVVGTGPTVVDLGSA